MDYGEYTFIVLASYGLAGLVLIGFTLKIWHGRRR